MTRYHGVYLGYYGVDLNRSDGIRNYTPSIQEVRYALTNANAQPRDSVESFDVMNSIVDAQYISYDAQQPPRGHEQSVKTPIVKEE